MEIPSKTISATLYDGTTKEVKIFTSIPFRKAQQIKNEVFGSIQVKGSDATAPASAFIELETKVTNALWHGENVDIDNVDFDKSPELAELLEQKLAEFQKRINAFGS